MTEVKYMISDVSRILDIPTNVLRYLEYCLSLNIKRTELGYRYYLQEDIDLLGNVRILRDKGFHMKVIKSILPYIDKVKDLDASKLYELRERLEAALGLSGLEAKESLKAQYGKVIDINMEEGDFVYKDPSTQQKTRLSSVLIKTEEVNAQPIALEVDNNRSCEEVAATDVVMRESHMDEETTNLSENYEFSNLENSINYKEKEFFTDRKSRKKKEKKVTQIYDLKQAKPCHYMGAKKMNNIVDVMKFEDQPEEKIEEDKLEEDKLEEVEEKVEEKLDEKAEGAPKVEEEDSLQAKTETKTEPMTEEKREETRSEEKGLYSTQDTMLKLNQDKIVQFREIMYSIVMDAVRQNNHTLTNDINDTVTQSIVKEMDYMMRVREERQEEKFRQLDRTIRETQLQRQQAAATKEGKKKKPSKFFQKNKVHI